jgi:hypothetical protein
MGVRVVSDNVTACGNLTGQARILPYVFAKEEKRGRNVVPVKQRQQARRDRGIWTIIESQRARVSGAGNHWPK